MTSDLDLPKIEIFDHEIIAALCVVKNENATYSESAQRGNTPVRFQFQKDVQTKRTSW